MGGLSGSGPRWFIALSPTAPGELLSRLGAPPLPLRLFHPADLHVTLAFLGDCAEGAADAAWRHTRESPPPAVCTRVSEARLLGVPSAPSAWSLLLAPDPALAAWVSRHSTVLLDSAGGARETRPFLAHLTVARGATADAVARERLLEWLRGLQGLPVELASVGLFRRAAHGQARRYEERARRQLRAS